jgi:hypothetical protein
MTFAKELQQNFYQSTYLMHSNYQKKFIDEELPEVETKKIASLD